MNTDTALFRMWSEKIRDNIIANQGTLIEKGLSVDPNTAIQPTFLYESVWCIALFLILHFFVIKRRKFKGEAFLLYGIGYGLERAVVEGMRTDSLYFAGTTVRVSQVLSAAIVVVFAIWLIVMLVKLKKGTLPRRYQINPAPLVPVYTDTQSAYEYSNCASKPDGDFFFRVVK